MRVVAGFLQFIISLLLVLLLSSCSLSFAIHVCSFFIVFLFALFILSIVVRVLSSLYHMLLWFIRLIIHVLIYFCLSSFLPLFVT